MRRHRHGARWGLAAAAVAAGCVAAGFATGTGGAATSTRAVVVTDGRDARVGSADLTRMSFQRAKDGRLRAAITLAEAWDAEDLRARSGPPGSICVRLWTASDPPDEPPDYLVCVTARRRGERLRASVLRERPNQLPERVGAAAVAKTSRSVVVRFSQTSVGRPAAIDFSAEATRAGCVRVSCIDTAPNAPDVSRLTLRKPARTGR